jgi:RHS repeat-associated protein
MESTAAHHYTTLSQAGVSHYHVAGAAGAPTTVAVGRTGRYVRVQLAGTNYLTLSEVEVFDQAQASSTGGAVNWLVSDHLGTPRMVVDLSGNLGGPTGIKRHDYLPFGEELGAGIGGRTTAQGYAEDSIRQHFTSKERDNETGLDYFLARYYGSSMGRFTSPDEFTGGPRELFTFAAKASANPTFYADLNNPQSLNKYTYCLNNPLRYVDPDGHKVKLNNDNDRDRREVAGRLLFNLAKNERQYFKVAYDKKTSEYSLALKGNVDRALGKNHTAAFEKLVTAVRHQETIGVSISDTFQMKGSDKVISTTDFGGGGVTVPKLFSSTGEVQVYLSRQGNTNPDTQLRNANGKVISDPVSIIAGHEVLGHALGIITGQLHGEFRAREVENEIRRGRGLDERDLIQQFPQRSPF